MRNLEYLKSNDKKTNQYLIGCFTKKRYCTEEFSKQKAIKLANKYKCTYWCYFCTDCGGYHLTTKKIKGKSYCFEITGKEE